MEFYNNFTSENDKQIFNQYRMDDPEITSAAVISALTILNSMDSMTMLDFNKVEPIFKLAIVQSIKDQQHKEMQIKRLKVILSVLANKYSISASSLLNKILNILFTEFKFPATQLTTTKVKIFTNPFNLNCDNAVVSDFTKQKYADYATEQIIKAPITQVEGINFQNNKSQFDYSTDVVTLLAEAFVAVDMTIVEKGREALVKIPTIANVIENSQTLQTRQLNNLT